MGYSYNGGVAVSTAGRAKVSGYNFTGFRLFVRMMRGKRFARPRAYAQVVFILLVACSEPARLVEADPRTVPEVVVSRPIGNPPVEGTVELVPRAAEIAGPSWTFQVDLGNDGSIEETGVLEATVSVPFSFESPGLHRILVVFVRPGERTMVVRRVNVLDPDRIEVLARVRLEGRPLLEGVAVDRTGSTLYVAKSFRQTVLKMDPVSLAVLDTLQVPEATNTLEGLAIAPDEALLYVVTKFLDLWLIDLEDFATTAFLDRLASGMYYLEARPGRRVYSSGNGELALLDIDASTIVRELRTQPTMTAEHFAVSPSGNRIAAIVLGPGEIEGGIARSSLVVTDPELAEISRTEPRDLVFEHVAWSPGGDRIYLRYARDVPGEVAFQSNVCGIFVLDAASLEFVKDIPLGVEGECSAFDRGRGVANPVASSPDGRFVVFPSPSGAFVFDTQVDRPVARTPGSGAFRGAFCCDVAASPNDDVFYVVGSEGQVTAFEVLR